jgi:hypothetical protein
MLTEYEARNQAGKTKNAVSEQRQDKNYPTHESPTGDPTTHTACCCCPTSCRFAAATTDCCQQEAAATEFSPTLHPLTSCSGRGSTTNQLWFSHDYAFSSNPGSITTVEDCATTPPPLRNSHSERPNGADAYKDGDLIVMHTLKLKMT